MADDARGPTRPFPSQLRLVAAVVLLIGVTGLALGYALGAPLPEWPAHWSADSFERLIGSWGAWGVAASIGLMVLHSFVPFPAEFVAMANGMVYGPLWGTAITWLGAMLGAFAAFGLARALGRPFVKRAASRGEWHKIDDWLARQGGSAVFISRFLPVISFNMINYAAGLAPISWRTFTWATGLGILPMTMLMVILGDQFDALPWWSWLLLLAGGVALWLICRRMLPWVTKASRRDLADRPATRK